MRNNYFEKLVNYMKKDYHIETGLKKLTDARINPTYNTSQVIAPVLFGFLLRVKSFNELGCMLKENEFNKLFTRGTKLPKIDTIRDTLKVIDIKGLNELNQHIVKRAFENKVFENGTIDGHTVVAIDGTKFFGSNKKSCTECVKNNNYSFHSGAIMSTVGIGPKLVIDFEMYKAGVDSVSKNNNKSLRQVKKKVNKLEPIEVWKEEKVLEKAEVYESMFLMENVEQPLHFIKFAMKYLNKKRSQIMIVTTCIDMSLKTLYKIIKVRWDIENSIFYNLKTECGLEHCYIHGGNAVEVVIYLIFIASDILQLFLYRRLKKRNTT